MKLCHALVLQNFDIKFPKMRGSKGMKSGIYDTRITQVISQIYANWNHYKTLWEKGQPYSDSRMLSTCGGTKNNFHIQK